MISVGSMTFHGDDRIHRIGLFEGQIASPSKVQKDASVNNNNTNEKSKNSNSNTANNNAKEKSKSNQNQNQNFHATCS